MSRSLILAAAAVLLAGAGTAHAGLLPVTYSVTPESGSYRWTYAIVLPTDTQIQKGDYFTIYDFGGYVVGSQSAPADWTFNSTNTGTTPLGVKANAACAVPNLTWTYNGATTTGQVGLGNFWAVSPYGDGKEADFTALSHNAAYGIPDSNITTTTVPVQVPAPPGVPEPATLALAGIGLPLLGLRRGLRRRSRA